MYNYGCLSYNSKPECKTCDGFGKNSDIKLEELKECYITKEQMREDLDLNKKVIGY